MKQTNKSTLLRYLKSQKLMFLATVSRNPWIATLYYAIDANFDIYCVSEENTSHSKNILNNNNVSCGIADSHQKVNHKKIGVQLSGIAQSIKDVNETKYALALWNKENPGLEETINFKKMKTVSFKMYVIHPREIKFFNEKLYGADGAETFTIKPQKTSIFKGLIDAEALSKKEFKKLLSIGFIKEKNPDNNPPYIYVHKIFTKGRTIEEAARPLAQVQKRGWYGVFWDKNTACFIFKNKTITLPYNWTKIEFEKILKYAKSEKLEPVHFSEIKESMKTF